MAAVKRFFTNWWTLAVLATLLVSLVLFFLCGPLVGALLPSRWWAILFVWVVFGVVAGVRWLRRRAAEKALAAAMAGPADLEGEAISGKMKAALDRAKAGGPNGKGGRSMPRHGTSSSARPERARRR